ncbi:MAG: hypothetical protein M1826_007083 [Phylliscum demangeonii]|nr:MAG: hypothetical protein M1826_007083 [Phylliscum demangeonii]
MHITAPRGLVCGSVADWTASNTESSQSATAPATIREAMFSWWRSVGTVSIDGLCAAIVSARHLSRLDRRSIRSTPARTSDAAEVDEGDAIGDPERGLEFRQRIMRHDQTDFSRASPSSGHGTAAMTIGDGTGGGNGTSPAPAPAPTTPPSPRKPPRSRRRAPPVPLPVGRGAPAAHTVPSLIGALVGAGVLPDTYRGTASMEARGEKR